MQERNQIQCLAQIHEYKVLGVENGTQQENNLQRLSLPTTFSRFGFHG